MTHLSKWKISVYLAAIFFAGVVTGLFAAFELARHLMPNPERLAARWSAELQSKLDLTPAQVQKIDPIIKDTMAELKAIFTLQIPAAIANANARIAGELTPEQKAKFEEIVRAQEEFMRKKFQDGMDKQPKKQ